MILAIISDIHGNLEALDAALKQIKKQKPDKIYCLGDVVGYGANPNECCEIIRETADAAVVGNHDAACTGLMDFSWFNPVAIASLQWTQDILTLRNKDWLSSLPYYHEEGNLVFSHGMLYRMEEFYYDDEMIPIYYSFERMGLEQFVSFIGHSHKHNVLKAERETNKLNDWQVTADSIPLEQDHKYLINVGSVGQPRDQNPDGSYVIYDSEKRVAEFKRVKYDVETAAKKILEKALPSILAERLFMGV